MSIFSDLVKPDPVVIQKPIIRRRRKRKKPEPVMPLDQYGLATFNMYPALQHAGLNKVYLSKEFSKLDEETGIYYMYSIQNELIGSVDAAGNVTILENEK